jgi:hypothetical protein
LIRAQAIFLHSIDDTFERTGNKSLIPYEKLFSTYKQIIMMKLSSQDKEFQEMIRWYNSQVFDWFKNDNSKGHGDLSSSGIDEVMNQMEDLVINPESGIERQLESDGNAERVVCFIIIISISHSNMRCQSLFKIGAHPKSTHQQSPDSWTLGATRCQWLPNSAI